MDVVLEGKLHSCLVYVSQKRDDSNRSREEGRTALNTGRRVSIRGTSQDKLEAMISLMGEN